MILQFLTLLGAIGMFLYGLNILRNGILKLTGEKLKKILPWMQKNPLNSILAGIGITSISASSGAATVMVVSFVNAGALTLAKAILVIMGANIGASLTTWIIAIFGFCPEQSVFTYPLIALGFLLMMMKGQKKKVSGEAILGFALIFLGLSYTVSNFPSTADFPHGSAAFIQMSSGGYLSVLLFMAIGCILASILQSTGAVTITMIMLGTGWIGFDMAAAMVMGENIGTTLTANLAASDANVQAKRAALVHTLFNVTGAVLALIFFHPLLKLTGMTVSFLGLPDPCTSLDLSRDSVLAGVFGTATFHTYFNLLNTCLLAWFTKPLEKLVTRLVSAPENSGDEEDLKFKYITARHFGTPAISISLAYKEVAQFGKTMHDGFSLVSEAVNETDPDKFEVCRRKLVQMEEFSDKMEYRIADFLNAVTTESISEDEAGEIKILYRIIGELESLGDSGENISRILEREKIHNRILDSDSVEKINIMIDTVDKAYGVMVENLDLAASSQVTDISNAYKAEDVINDTRDRLRNDGISRIELHTGNYQSLNYFLDIIAELEAMGDFMINVSQALVKKN